MKLIENLRDLRQPFPRAVVTIGNFDGVHIGHQALFHQVIERSDAVGGTSVAMTFEPHPLRVLKKNGHPPLITLYEQKKELIAATGIDVLICVPFTLEFAALSAEAFVKDILVDRIGMRTIVVGEDYAFGRNREGDLTLLKAFAARHGFEVVVGDWIRLGSDGLGRISSTRVRDLVAEGEVALAQKLLGRCYQVRGTVTTGRNRGGKLLGFPTANLNLQDELCPRAGVYAVTVECRGARHLGVANIGYSPTFEDRIFTVEVHILDFDADIYNENIRVNFVQRIRDEIRFGSIAELSDQIRRDIATARGILK